MLIIANVNTSMNDLIDPDLLGLFFNKQMNIFWMFYPDIFV